jgi:hypothetical protein
MASINGRTKGITGEQEVARDLNAIVDDCLQELGMPRQDPCKPRIQRNQNQTAVGGCDLTGTFDLAIEVKRQEQLAINSWWAQCCASATSLRHTPVLLFRQNTPAGGRKAWRVITLVDVAIPGCEALQCRAEISYDDFRRWFRAWALEHLRYEFKLTTPTSEEIKTDVAPEIAPVRTRLPDLFDGT